MKEVLEQRLLLVEAGVLLLAARLALKVLPFRWLAWYFARPARGEKVMGAERERLKNRVFGTVWKASRLLPAEVVCFPRAIAAQTMLRRRGVSTTLVYGVATEPSRGLTGHVWPQDEKQGVVDHRFTQGYHPLARFPAT